MLSIELESDDGTIAVGGAPHGFELHLSFLWAFFSGKRMDGSSGNFWGDGCRLLSFFQDEFWICRLVVSTSRFVPKSCIEESVTSKLGKSHTQEQGYFQNLQQDPHHPCLLGM